MTTTDTMINMTNFRSDETRARVGGAFAVGADGFIGTMSRPVINNYMRIIAALIVIMSSIITTAQAQDGEGGYDAPYFQADFTQDLNSWSSALVNPALLPRVNQMRASMALYRWGMDRGNMGYQDFSFLYPARLRHTAGVTVLHARNAIDRVTAGPAEGELENMGQVVYQDLWVIGNYGVRILPWLSLGANVKMRTQQQFGQSAVSRVPGLDVGAYLTLMDHYYFGELGLSLNAQDILPTQTPWAFQNVADATDLITVSRGRAGVRYAGLNDNLIVSFEILVDNAFRDIFNALPWNEFEEAIRGGSIPNVEEMDISDLFPIALRWGFHARYMFIPQIWLAAGWTNNNIPYLGFSYNFMYPTQETINYLTLDYNFGYSFMENFGGGGGTLNDERGLVMMLRLSTDFGRTREQKESRRYFGRLVLAPMDAYNEAMRLYSAGRWWEASFAFGRLMTLYPTFFLNDRAMYYLGDCYKRLYMNDIAREVFTEGLAEYEATDMRAFYLYGLMSIDYREEKYGEALRIYAFLLENYPDSEIIGEAEYLAGEIALAANNFERARAHFALVKETDPSYLFALYSLSKADIETDREQAAINSLTRILDDPSNTAEHRHLQSAAAVRLGHIHFEGQRLREAVSAYALVNESGQYGDEANLGTAWAWAKAGQPQQTLRHADRIISHHRRSPLIPEAYLLRGYALMLLRRFPEAVIAFERAIALSQASEFVTDDMVRERSARFATVTREFAPTAEQIKRNTLRRPTQQTIDERPALQRNYQEFARENREYFELTVLARHHRHFFMRKDQIIDDASYAVAIAMRNAQSARVAAGMSGTGADAALDSELERLRRELAEIDAVRDAQDAAQDQRIGDEYRFDDTFRFEAVAPEDRDAPAETPRFAPQRSFEAPPTFESSPPAYETPPPYRSPDATLPTQTPPSSFQTPAPLPAPMPSTRFESSTPPMPSTPSVPPPPPSEPSGGGSGLSPFEEVFGAFPD